MNDSSWDKQEQLSLERQVGAARGEDRGGNARLSSQWDVGRRRPPRCPLELGTEGLPGVWRGAGTFAPCLPGIPGMPRSP